jgi:hypothetical protein
MPAQCIDHSTGSPQPVWPHARRSVPDCPRSIRCRPLRIWCPDSALMRSTMCYPDGHAAYGVKRFSHRAARLTVMPLNASTEPDTWLALSATVSAQPRPPVGRQRLGWRWLVDRPGNWSATFSAGKGAAAVAVELWLVTPCRRPCPPGCRGSGDRVIDLPAGRCLHCL